MVSEWLRVGCAMHSRWVLRLMRFVTVTGSLPCLVPCGLVQLSTGSSGPWVTRAQRMRSSTLSTKEAPRAPSTLCGVDKQLCQAGRLAEKGRRCPSREPWLFPLVKEAVWPVQARQALPATVEARLCLGGRRLMVRPRLALWHSTAGLVGGQQMKERLHHNLLPRLQL